MKNCFVLLILLVPLGLQASDCKYSKNIDQALDLAGSEALVILAAAGDLRVRGTPNSERASIQGKVCTSRKEWLADSRVETSGGKRAEIAVVLTAEDGWSLRHNHYLKLDLELEVPDNLALEIRDSSGGMDVSGVGALTVEDSSGSITIEDTLGPVTIDDSSGGIYLSDIGSDVTINSDSSGEIRGSYINGNVLVRRDGSGEIDFSDVTQSVIVERDSSGGIFVNRVGGDFRVERDGSGEIDARNVKGEVDIPDHGS